MTAKRKPKPLLMKNITKITVSVLLLAGIVGVSLVHVPEIEISNPNGKPQSTDENSRFAEERMQNLGVELKESHQTHLARLRILEQGSLARIAAVVCRHEQSISSASYAAAKPFQGVKNTGYTGMLYAADIVTWQSSSIPKMRITPTRHLEEYSNAALAPIVRLCASTQREIITELEAHIAAVKTIQNQYMRDTLEIVNAHDLSESVGVKLNFESFSKTYSDAAQSNVAASISSGLEVILIGTTYTTIRKVLRIIAEKLAKSAGTSIIAAAADGPLPIGDIVAAVIAAGGLAWTAHDIYVASEEQEKLPGKIGGNARATLKRMQDEARTMIRKSSAPEFLPMPTITTNL
jgi:hypothetical protein